MTNVIWNGTSGDWTDPDNWTPDQVPVSGDTATIAGTGTTDVSIDGSESVAVDELVMNDPLASLDINGSLAATEILLQSGTINNYGTLADTTVINSGGDFEFGYGLLKGDTWQGDLVVDGEGYAVVQGGLTALSLDGTGPGAITIDGADSTLLFNDTETFDNATITMGSATGLANLDAGGTVTFGSGVTIQSTTTAFLDDSLGGEGTIINDGTITADAASGEMDLESPTFINNGAITATGGVTLDIQPYGTFANNGTLTVGNGSVASIQYLNAFTNTGTIEINGGGELDIDTYASALTQAQATGGTVEIDGLLNAEGETLNLAADSAFSTILNYGTLENATLLENGGTLDIGYGLFKADTIQGTLDVNGESEMVVQGGLTAKSLDGTGPGAITIDGADSTLLFNDTETFDNATITMGSATGLANLDAGGTVTFGSGVTIQSTTTAFLDDSLGGEGTIINDGTITADAASGEMDLESPTFINNGAITATGGVTLDIQPYGTFANNGTLTVGNGSVASIQYLNAFTNTGTIEINGGGELDIDTYASALTQAQATGGTVEIDGLLNAEGETLNLAADSAFSTILNYGTLENATLLENGGTLDIGYGLFKADTVQGTLDVNGESEMVVQGGLTAKSLDGTGPGAITIDGADSTLLFNDTETFDNATITMGSATGLANLDAGGTVTFGSGVTIQSTTTAFLDDSLGGEGTIINDGTITADAASGEMDLESPTFINNGAITATGGVTLDIQPYGTFANNGTLTVGNGSVASIQYLNAFTNTGTIEINGGGELDIDTYASALTQAQATGGTVEIDGLLNAEGETLNLAADSAFSTILNYGTLENATLLENGGTLDIGYGLFKADTIQGTFDINGESTAEIQGGLTALSLDGTGPGDITIDGADSTLLFNDTETFDNATITMGSATGLANLDAGGTLTLGSGVTIQTSAADFFDDSLGGEGTIINDGTITADATSGELDLESPTFINNGDISVAYGTSLDIQPYGTFANNGTLTVGEDSVAAIQYLNAFTNTGTITVDAGGELDIDTYASALTQAQATGGTVEIDGLLNAEGETLNIAADSAFSTITNNGTIENATFVLNGGTLGIGDGLFQADTVQGDFEIGGDSTAEIQGGLTAEALGGTGTGSVTIDGDDSTLQFDDTETFDNATITMGSATGVDTLDAEGTLTLGSGVIVQTASDIDVVSLEGSGTIVNDGAIIADANDGEVDLESDSFVNNGAIIVTGGTDLNVETSTAFDNAGTMTISDGSIASVQYMDSFTNTGVIAVDDATLIVDTATTAGATDGVTELSGNSLAVYDLDVDATQTVAFMDGSDSELDLADASSFLGTISGFQEGNSIDLEGYAGDTYSFADDTLTFSENGGVSATLHFAGTYTASDFSVAETASGDLLVTTDVLPCFAEGTRIRTPRGDVAVETLREGDEVVTVTDGIAHVMPITWIGRRAVDIRRHSAPDKVRPVRIRQGAFADNLPARDLLLSPDHAVFGEGVLVPVKHLVNGTTILAETAARHVVYFHVELARHEVLLAEGLPTESYLETGGRGMFENAGLPVVLHADFARLAWDALSCAELKVTGAEVDAIRATLGARAADVAGSEQRLAG